MALWTLYKRELNGYFQSAVAYIVLLGAAIIQGFEFILLVTAVSKDHYKEQSVMQIVFTWQLSWLLILVPIPLITMRVFSEEFKLGTIEMLLTAPVREWDVVLAKFLGALTFFLIIWLPLVLDLTSLQLFSVPPPPIYWSQIWITALTMMLVGSFYVSIGVFTSALTRNQIVAAVLCFAFLFLFFAFSFFRFVAQANSIMTDWISYLSTPDHFQNAVRGIFDSRPLVFYISMTFLMLLLTKSVLEARRLKS